MKNVMIQYKDKDQTKKIPTRKLCSTWGIPKVKHGLSQIGTKKTFKLQDDENRTQDGAKRYISHGKSIPEDGGNRNQLQYQSCILTTTNQTKKQQIITMKKNNKNASPKPNFNLPYNDIPDSELKKYECKQKKNMQKIIKYNHNNVTDNLLWNTVNANNNNNVNAMTCMEVIRLNNHNKRNYQHYYKQPINPTTVHKKLKLQPKYPEPYPSSYLTLYKICIDVTISLGPNKDPKLIKAKIWQYLMQ